MRKRYKVGALSFKDFSNTFSTKVSANTKEGELRFSRLLQTLWLKEKNGSQKNKG